MYKFRFIMAALAAASATCAFAQDDSQKCGLIGFANYRDLVSGTTGGGNGEIVRVATREQLQKYAGDNTPRIIIIENDITGKGNIGEGAAGVKDYISIGSNKTIIGAGSGVTLRKVGFDANGKSNIIIRNLRITDCNPDALAFRNTDHVWVDHCDLSNCADGLLDFTIGSSYLSVSWTKFSNHDKVSICNSGTNHFEDNGKERATYHHCWFDNTTQRNPRFGYGLGHVFNNYYTNNSSYCVGYHTRAQVVVENSLFKNTHTPLQQMYSDDAATASYADCLSRGNKFENVSGNTKDTGKGFDISRYYDYSGAMDKAEDIESSLNLVGLKPGLEYEAIPFPGNYASDVLKNTQLQCGSIYGATKYKYMIARDTQTDAAPDYTVYDPESTPLNPGTAYRWFVETVTQNGTIQSGIFHFTTASEKASKPTPADGDEHAKLREALKDKTPCSPARLRWRSAFDAMAYRVYLNEGATVGDENYKGETNALSFNPGPLLYGRQYSWRVDAVKKDGTVVTGDTWTFSSDMKEASYGRTEMEDATLNGYAYIERGSTYRTYSGDNAVVGEAGPGCMSVVWSEDDDDCDITTTFFDWQKKNGTFTLFVNEQKQDSWIATVDGKNMFTHTSKSIRLKRGDEIRINFCTDGNQRIRTDCMDIAKAASTGINDIDDSGNCKSLRIFTVDGRFAGSSIEPLPSGVYIVNGRKIAK